MQVMSKVEQANHIKWRQSAWEQSVLQPWLRALGMGGNGPPVLSTSPLHVRHRQLGAFLALWAPTRPHFRLGRRGLECLLTPAQVKQDGCRLAPASR